MTHATNSSAQDTAPTHATVWLGRGGQGAFTAARLLGIAAMLSGRHALVMPSFGPERRGAPVFAYTRIAPKRIDDRSAVDRAHATVVLDESLLSQVPTPFLTTETHLVIDSESVVASDPGGRTLRVPARRMAQQILGSEHTNSLLFGALVGLTDIVPLDAAEAAIRQELGDGMRGTRNIEALRWAHGFAIDSRVAELRRA